MAALLQQLSGNPLATPIGMKIEHATETKDEDWALIMEICDDINDTDEGPRDAVRAIRKRFQQNAGRNNSIVMRTLVVLETCVKNCGRRFHLLVTSKDFIQELIKLIGPKNDPPPALQEKVLTLIQSWADAFKGQPDLNGVYQMYLELKTKGIEFPAQDLDSMAPIHTPQRSVHPPPPHSMSRQQSSATPPGRQMSFETGPIRLTPDQMDKLNQELAVVQGNITVFEEMLTELTPGSEHSDDWALLEELNGTCRSMQKRIMKLIDRVTNEDVTIELLRVNDSFNNCFVRYDRFLKKRSKVPSPMAMGQPQFPVKSQPTKKPAENSLIDLGDEEPAAAAAAVDQGLIANVSNLRIGNRPPSDDFDAFAHSRSSKNGVSTRQQNIDAYAEGKIPQASGLASLAQAKTQRDLTDIGLIDKKEDLDEMEKWLMEQEATGASASTTGRQTTTTATVDNSDFERFLYERASATDPPSQDKTNKKDNFDL